MNDLELSEHAKKLMIERKYDEAIKTLRKMENQIISTKMELLVIEHEALNTCGYGGPCLPGCKSGKGGFCKKENGHFPKVSPGTADTVSKRHKTGA